MKIGRLKAKIRSLEQEKMEARLLKYWAHIIERDEGKFLLLIPKENMSLARDFLEKKDDDTDGVNCLYTFNSLTLRALNKLIRRNLGKEQMRLRDDSVALYKEVLRGTHKELENIDLSGFRDEIKVVLEGSFANEDDFRIALERVSYVCIKKRLNDKSIEKIKSDFGALEFKISSYDLERNIQGNKKEHTRIWDDFWSAENQANNFSTRLNPEIRLFYRPQRIQTDAAKQHNRFSKEHFGVAFTISQNAAQKKYKTAFVEEKILPEMVKKFNDEVIGVFAKERNDNLWYYGIDRGHNELATLCVVRYLQEKYGATLPNGKVAQFNIPIPAPIKLYRIKDEHLRDTKEIIIDSSGTKKSITLLDNPSCFIDEIEKFDEVDDSCIDLTTAKLIKGKIILNGDIQTYIALKKISGKRQLFEKFSKIDPSAQIEFDETGSRFQIKSCTGERDAYQFLPYYGAEQEKIFSRENIKKEFQDYLDKLRENKDNEEDVSIEKINHLRDAITANMVGIIAFLFKQYPGIINLENLSKDQIDHHFKGSGEDITCRLEWSLYKKFQKFGLVPPKLRQTVLLRKSEENKDGLKQFGIINFVSAEGTSARCPHCDVSVSGKQREEDKFKQHCYICRNNEKNCGFTTTKPRPPLDFIKNSDDVAAYNIAKLGRDMMTRQISDEGVY